MIGFKGMVLDRLARLVLAMTFIAAASALAQAATHISAGASARFDGGAGPDVVDPGVDRIEGTISGGDEGDLFKLVFSVGGVLTIRVDERGGAINPSLYLFDAAGGGLRADDNSGPALDSLISITIAPGTYYIGIGDEPLTAVDTDGSVWASSLVVDSGPPADFGTLDRLRQVGTIVSPGDYAVILSIPTAGEPVSTVPEPETAFLLAASLLTLGALGARRLRAMRVASIRRR